MVPQFDAVADALVEAFGPVVLVGNSLGATTAIHAAARHGGSVAGVVALDGEAHVGPGADVDEQSFVFRFAAAAAHAGIPMSSRALRLLASRGTPPGEEWSERTRQAFVSLLGSGEWLVPTAEALERYSLLSRFVPEWRVVRSLPQRNAFHRFTVDHHLLQTIANAAVFVRDVKRPDLLLVGALTHDLGKGRPGDHTEVGVELCDVVLRRMGFDDEDHHDPDDESCEFQKSAHGCGLGCWLPASGARGSILTTHSTGENRGGAPQAVGSGAGDGNRTHVISLGS